MATQVHVLPRRQTFDEKPKNRSVRQISTALSLVFCRCVFSTKVCQKLQLVYLLLTYSLFRSPLFSLWAASTDILKQTTTYRQSQIDNSCLSVSAGWLCVGLHHDYHWLWLQGQWILQADSLVQAGSRKTRCLSHGNISRHTCNCHLFLENFALIKWPCRIQSDWENASWTVLHTFSLFPESTQTVLRMSCVCPFWNLPVTNGFAIVEKAELSFEWIWPTQRWHIRLPSQMSHGLVSGQATQQGHQQKTI